MNRFTWIAAAAMIVLLTAVPAPAQSTIHVDDDAPGDPGPGDPAVSDPLEDGTLDHPYDAIQEGIDAAVNGDTVLVADGTYTGEGNRDIDFFGKAIVVRSENGPESCIVDIQGAHSRGVVFHNGEGSDSLLKGLTITGNQDYYYYDGGGIYCSSASPTIAGNIITDCWAANGGGICVYNGSPLIEGNIISDNDAEWEVNLGDGGGIRCTGTGAATVRGNEIIGNHGDADGGGIYATQEAIIIEGNIINDNVASGDWFGGGGICLFGCAGAMIAGNEIIGNSGYVGVLGGGHGGGISCTSSAGVSLTGNRIIGNQATWLGGGIHIDNGRVGGPRDADHSTREMSLCANNLITGNEVTHGNGGGVFCDNTPVSFINVTIVGNSTENDGGGVGCHDADVQIVNSIVRGNAAGSDPELYFSETVTATVAHSNVEGGWPGPGNIDADPLFVTGPEGDHYLSQVASGQGADSPCVDAGQNLAAGTCWTTADGVECLSGVTTRTDGINDQGTADMGYHYPALDPVSAWLSCQPSSGVLPFTTTIALGLENNPPGAYRKVAGRIDLVLGNGTAFPSWRAGHLVLRPGEWYGLSWGQLIPEILPAYDENRFTLVAADVTPAPYNQPPYPPSGSTDWARCTVTGLAP